MKSLAVYMVFALFTTAVIAQQQPVLTPLAENDYFFNPASAGALGYTKYSLATREQWAGLSQAPKTNSFAFQTRILKRGKQMFNPISWVSKDAKQNFTFLPNSQGRVGLGATFTDDRNGLISRTGFKLTYAYHITLPDKQFSFGLSFAGQQLRLHTANAVNVDLEDPVLTSDNTRMFLPDADLGFYMLTRDYGVGVSATNIVQSGLQINKIQYDNGNINNYRYFRNYTLMGNYNFYTEYWKFSPYMMLMVNERLYLQNSLSLTGTFQEKFQFGLGYRANLTNPYSDDLLSDVDYGSNLDCIVIIGLNIKSFNFIYSFDYPFSALGAQSYGSHSLIASFNIGETGRRSRWQDKY